jgi:hypothetical protein
MSSAAAASNLAFFWARVSFMVPPYAHLTPFLPLPLT